MQLNDENKVTIHSREECAIVPQGVSCTETIMAYYIRIRKADKILSIRVAKETLEPTSLRLEDND
jgi:hypothetical protein